MKTSSADQIRARVDATDADPIVRSALWAAYGDALGFITEFANPSSLQRRLGSARATQTVAWSRRVGGKFGPTVELPAGCYSDDTQLRLAAGRAISPDGSFDADVFSKVELPVWLGYALGAGRGSKAAAKNLARREVTWATNFFSRERAVYIDGGGNGAAMRIQPHVWAAVPGQRTARRVLRQIMVNSVSTHGHPRGIVGALFHGLCLAFALDERKVPDPDTLASFAQRLGDTTALIAGHEELSGVWAPMWERRAGRSLDDAMREAAEEVKADLHEVEGLRANDEGAYREAVQRLGATESQQRGSGTKTAVLAATCAWMFSGDAARGVDISANALGTDTDTIATMAGALLGSVSEAEPDCPLMDAQYIASEAQRLAEIGSGQSTVATAYPDLLRWSPPKVQLDIVGQIDGGDLVIQGLGPAVAVGEDVHEGAANSTVWQWLELSWGQRLLTKRRDNPAEVDATVLPVSTTRVGARPAPEGREAQGALFPDSSQPPSGSEPSPEGLDDLLEEVIRRGFDDELIGRRVRELSGQATDRAIAFTAMVAQALRERSRP